MPIHVFLRTESFHMHVWQVCWLAYGHRPELHSFVNVERSWCVQSFTTERLGGAAKHLQQEAECGLDAHSVGVGLGGAPFE